MPAMEMTLTTTVDASITGLDDLDGVTMTFAVRADAQVEDLMLACIQQIERMAASAGRAKHFDMAAIWNKKHYGRVPKQYTLVNDTFDSGDVFCFRGEAIDWGVASYQYKWKK